MLHRFFNSGNNECAAWLRSWILTRLRLQLCIAIVLFSSTITTIADESELPELGDSASQVLSPAREKRIGQEYVRQLLQNNTHISDPELNAYLNRLGAKIEKNASLRNTPITVHLIENEDLNAFAVPGGHITFHTGLILATESESELASVMGHEIAHITQRHLPRLLAKTEASKFPATAAILASVLVGGQVGLAGISLANAVLISKQLSYTREFEREADSIGIKLLAESGFDPTAMGRFFNKLDRSSGLNDTPEFLRTHPLSYNRIAEAENRSAAYPVKTYPSQLAFHLTKAKIYARYSPLSLPAIEYFTAQLESEESSDDEKDAAVYGIALAHLDERKFEEARETLKPLLKAHPNESFFQQLQAEIDLMDGKPELAVERYQKLMKAQPELRYITYYYVDALLANQDVAAAKRLIRHQLRRNKDMYQLYPLLSKTNGELKLLAEAHQATAEFHAALGAYQEAVSSLQIALRESDPEGYLGKSIAARLSELEEKLKRQGYQ